MVVVRCSTARRILRANRRTMAPLRPSGQRRASMKLQVHGQSLRLRIDEAELARLLAGETILNTTTLGAGQVFAQSLELRAADVPELETSAGRWTVRLPRTVVDDYVLRLPCRDALAFELPLPGDATLSLRFEVDVRDSLQARGPRRRNPVAG